MAADRGPRRMMRALSRALAVLPRRQRAGPGSWQPGTFAGPDGSRSYLVYLPSGLGWRRAPLLVLLHGCRQTAAEFAGATGFARLADRHGFLIVCPQQSAWSHQQRCWRWFDARHQEHGAGEPAILAGITAAVGAERARWRVDPARVYVAGLSAGGGMALILAATYPQVYAAAGLHSAPAYRTAVNARGALAAMAGRSPVPPSRPDREGRHGIPPVIVFQGAGDTTVRPANGPLIAGQWLACRSASDADRIAHSRRRDGHAPDGRPYAVTSWYTTRGRSVLELWQVDGLAHAWSGGTAGGSYSDPHGPSASAAMWTFLSRQRR